jgi:hypothetical protein
MPCLVGLSLFFICPRKLEGFDRGLVGATWRILRQAQGIRQAGDRGAIRAAKYDGTSPISAGKYFNVTASYEVA